MQHRAWLPVGDSLASIPQTSVSIGRSVSHDVSEARWKERRIRELPHSVGLRSRLLQQDVRTTEVCNPALRPIG